VHDAELHQRLSAWRQAQTDGAGESGSAGCGMKQVCILGNGQLGRMLRQAGEPLGIVWPVGLEADPEAVPFQQSVITAEIERWPETALTRELAPPGVC
jgi:5-(carboxyamino)imidazole ribonucleotide synthase